MTASTLVAILALTLASSSIWLACSIFGHGRRTYSRRPYLLTPSEADFYRVLHVAIASDWHVFAQVRVADLLKISGRTPRQRSIALYKVASKSVDYVICDPQFQPRLVIELNDRTHDLEHRRDRDRFVAQACKWAELPLVFAANQRPFDPEAIRSMLTTNHVPIRSYTPPILLQQTRTGLKPTNQ